jgi:hypothetical protein
MRALPGVGESIKFLFLTRCGTQWEMSPAVCGNQTLLSETRSRTLSAARAAPEKIEWKRLN